MATQRNQDFIRRFRRGDTLFVQGVTEMASLMRKFKELGGPAAFGPEEFEAAESPDPSAPQPLGASAPVHDITHTEFMAAVQAFDIILGHIQGDEKPTGINHLPALYKVEATTG